MGSFPRDRVVPPPFLPRVSRTAGWISAVILRGGRVAGTWTYKKDARAWQVSVTLFDKLPAAGLRQLKAEAERLEAFLGGPLNLAIG